jgi:hypothetical protein
MNKLSFVLLLCLFLASCSGISQQQYDEALEEIEDLEARERALQAQIEDYASSIPELQQLVEEKAALFTEMEEQYEELLAENANIRRENRYLTQDNEMLFCEEKIDGMTYNDILTISSTLMAWVTNQDWAERSNMTVRDTIWNNTDTKLHGVHYTSAEDGERYLTWFLVYFDEFGWREGVFWLDGECWLEFDR